MNRKEDTTERSNVEAKHTFKKQVAVDATMSLLAASEYIQNESAFRKQTTVQKESKKMKVWNIKNLLN